MGTLPRFSLFRDRNWEESMADEFTDAIALLKADHRTVENLFAAFENARGKERKRKLAGEICDELKIHMTIEEEIFYPALRGKIEDDLLDEGYVEHDGAKVLINDIAAGGQDEEFYDAKVKVLSEQIEHHVKEEERPSDGMFAQARNAGVDLVALRDRMIARKQALMAQAEAGRLPPARPSVVEPA
jgi:hemerythrin superfamily protein